jgi:hypothetical protein
MRFFHEVDDGHARQKNPAQGKETSIEDPHFPKLEKAFFA